MWYYCTFFPSARAAAATVSAAAFSASAMPVTPPAATGLGCVALQGMNGAQVIGGHARHATGRLRVRLCCPAGYEWSAGQRGARPSRHRPIQSSDVLPCRVMNRAQVGGGGHTYTRRSARFRYVTVQTMNGRVSEGADIPTNEGALDSGTLPCRV